MRRSFHSVFPHAAVAVIAVACTATTSKPLRSLDMDGTCMGGSVRVNGTCYCPFGQENKNGMCFGDEAAGPCQGGQIAVGPASNPSCFCLHGGVWNGSQCVAPVATAAPPDTRSAGQVTADAATSLGMSCKDLGNGTWTCTPADGWDVNFAPMDVGASPPVTSFQIFSLKPRAFAQKCDTFKSGMDDLKDDPNAFTVNCNDQEQNFQFWTSVPWSPGPDAQQQMTDWVNKHLASRANAVKMLDSIGAIRH